MKDRHSSSCYSAFRHRPAHTTILITQYTVQSWHVVPTLHMNSTSSLSMSLTTSTFILAKKCRAISFTASLHRYRHTVIGKYRHTMTNTTISVFNECIATFTELRLLLYPVIQTVRNTDQNRVHHSSVSYVAMLRHVHV